MYFKQLYKIVFECIISIMLTMTMLEYQIIFSVS